MRGVQWLQRGHFQDPASKVVGKVWPLLMNSGQRISDWVFVEDSGWRALFLLAGGGRGES